MLHVPYNFLNSFIKDSVKNRFKNPFLLLTAKNRILHSFQIFYRNPSKVINPLVSLAKPMAILASETFLHRAQHFGSKTCFVIVCIFNKFPSFKRLLLGVNAAKYDGVPFIYLMSKAFLVSILCDLSPFIGTVFAAHMPHV
jgi:hypothetical protein